MNIKLQYYNSLINFNGKISPTIINKHSKKLSSDLIRNKDFLPKISIYDTGIKDYRIESLIVEKRERMIKQYPVPPEYTYIDVLRQLQNNSWFDYF